MEEICLQGAEKFRKLSGNISPLSENEFRACNLLKRYC
jgi:hypothetical protein